MYTQKKHANFEKEWRSMPFILDNETLKQTNEDLHKEQINLNKIINDLNSKIRKLDGDL